MTISERVSDAIRVLCARKPRYAVQRADICEGLDFARWFNVTPESLAASRALIETPSPIEKPAHINWLVMNFKHPYGGVFTILRAANHLETLGYKNRIIVYDTPSFSIDGMFDTIKTYFPALSQESFMGLKGDLPPSDYEIATFFTSCYKLIADTNTKRKLYFIQDFEPLFYPAGTQYAMCENTYRFPFHRIYNTTGLMNYIEANYPVCGTRATAFTPAVDGRYFRAPKPLSQPVKVLFYGRPGTPRNAYALVLAFAKALKQRYGDGVALVSAGEKRLPDAEGILENAGVVPYEELPEFYASFHFIVSFMLTKHPSYLPLEAMAASACVITNFNEANTWLLQDGENCIAPLAGVDMLMARFDEALNNPALYARLTQNASECVRRLKWEDALEAIAGVIASI